MLFSNKKAKMVCIAFIAFMVIFAANVFTCNSSAQDAQDAAPVAPTQVVVGPESNLYKYLHHVPVTTYEWAQRRGNSAFDEVSAGPGPLEPHALWVKDYCKIYESLSQFGAVFNGKIFISTDTAKSIYPGVSYAIDQNTGDILWSVPYTGEPLKLDNTHMMIGPNCFDIETGSLQWTSSAAVSPYIPELKLGISQGPSVGYAKTVQAWDFSDTSKKPVLKWTCEPQEDITYWCYGDNKVFCSGLDYHLFALDVQTGKMLWSRYVPSIVGRYHVGSYKYGNLYEESLNGMFCFDANTGALKWRTGLLETGSFTVNFGIVAAVQTRTYLWGWDAYDGHLVWKYLPVREIPHPCGPGAAGQCNHTKHHMGFYSPVSSSNGYIFSQEMQKTTYGSLVPANYPGVEYPVGSGTRYWVNPFDVPATSHAGENEMVCINIQTGEVVWRLGYGWKYSDNVGTAAVPAYEGPDFGHSILADGRLYGIEEPYSGHTGVGSSRPELDPGITSGKVGPFFKPILANYWRRGRVYCIGAGPCVLTASTDLANLKATEKVTISGSVTDLSPASPGEVAPNVPVELKWTLPDGSNGIINTVKTGEDGKFTYDWIPYTAGAYTITASSPGTPSYEAPDPAIMSLNVEPALNLLPLAEAGLVVVIIVAVAVPTIIYIRMRKQKA